MVDGPQIGTDVVQREDEHYRRGVVLGLTMAEIVTLIIFCLLMALVTLLRQKEDQITAMAASEKIYAAMQDAALKAGAAFTPEEIPDFFRDLMLKAEKAERLEREMAALREQEKIAAKAVADAIEATGQSDGTKAIAQVAKVAATIGQAIDKAGGKSITAEEKSRLIAATTAAAADIVAQDALSRKRGEAGKPTILETLAKTQEEGQKLTRENQDLQSQVKTLLAKNLEGGKGTEKPSCWYVQGTTKPEYIYDVALGSDGVSVFDIELTHRNAEKALLPLQAIQLSHTVGIDTFLEMTAALLQWSDAHDCRFFVRVYDETGASEKLVYKKHLNAVEQRFYKFQSFDPRPIVLRN